MQSMCAIFCVVSNRQFTYWSVTDLVTLILFVMRMKLNFGK